MEHIYFVGRSTLAWWDIVLQDHGESVIRTKASTGVARKLMGEIYCHCTWEVLSGDGRTIACCHILVFNI